MDLWAMKEVKMEAVACFSPQTKAIRVSNKF